MMAWLAKYTLMQILGGIVGLCMCAIVLRGLYCALEDESVCYDCRREQARTRQPRYVKENGRMEWKRICPSCAATHNAELDASRAQQQKVADEHKKLRRIARTNPDRPSNAA